MDEKPPQVDFEINVVDGEHGKRLAALQAQAVVDVLLWLSEHHRATHSHEDDNPTADEPAGSAVQSTNAPVADL
ncbi:hypothetical protein [Micromonospora sp. NPDC050276]|uniref:hypothetical protein n=1 Tax=Micromonospora sp. NPDC050276 TaxID=3364278 RepID=UPI00379AC1EA